MDDFAEELVKDYETHLQQEVRTFETPAPPGKSLVKAEPGKDPVNIDKCRSFVGRIMWHMR